MAAAQGIHFVDTSIDKSASANLITLQPA